MERLSRWKVELFCTDNWGVYPEVIVADKLYQSKSQTVYLGEILESCGVEMNLKITG